MKMKERCWMVLMGCVCIMYASAQEITLKSADLTVSIAENGFYHSIRVQDKDVLASEGSSLITACTEGELVQPERVEMKKDLLLLTMEDGKNITLSYQETPNCITLEAVKVPGSYDAILFGPVKASINDVVGEIVGVVQGKGVALGMQSMNIKTTAGIPTEYIAKVKEFYQYEGKGAELSVETTPDYKQAATALSDGACFQLACRNRSRAEIRDVQGLKGMEVLPVKGPDAFINGAKIAIFGCPAPQALERIGAIEVEQGLPHPLFDGEWGKTARSAMCSYLITGFSDKNIDFVLDKAEMAGFTYVYHGGPFEDWGHFNWSKSFVEGGDDASVKALVDKAAQRGISLGVHTLSNFTTTNDAYVTPVPSEHLLKQGTLQLTADIDASQNTLTIRKSTLFALPLTLNAMMIDKELITFGEVKEEGETMVLTNCKRGAFGTTAASHSKKSPLYKLWDYPYKTLFPDLELQDEYADRLIEMFNKTGLKQISFDGLEGCAYTGQDDYATTRFAERFFKGVGHNVLNDASRLNHFTWHIHTRMNWGEPWGEAMRTGQVENRIKNQKYFERNLFPRMLGWFLIRLADRKFECSTLEDLEWALSESAGFDAGYAMNINVNTLKRHGQIDELLTAIKNWDMLRAKQCFTPEQKERLKDPATEWHLEKESDELFLLYPLSISKRFNCSLSELQPGQPGGADWSVSTPYDGKYAIRLKVEGEGFIENPKFMTDKGTIVFPCQIEEGQYLLYGFDGKAHVTDKNYNIITSVTPQGSAEILAGDSHVAFSCDRDEDVSPDVTVRFITRGIPEKIHCK